MLRGVIRGCLPCLASLGSHDRGAQAFVRVAYYMDQAARTIRALLGSLRVAIKSWSLSLDAQRAGLMLWMLRLAQSQECLASLASYDRGASAWVRVAYLSHRKIQTCVYV